MYEDEEDNFEFQDIVISCSTEDCKTLSQSHELLIDVILENYEFAKIIVVLSTEHEEWIESFKVNYTEMSKEELEAEEADLGSVRQSEELEEEDIPEPKPNRFRTPKKPQSKQNKINFVLITVAEHFYSLLASLLKILYEL